LTKSYKIFVTHNTKFYAYFRSNSKSSCEIGLLRIVDDDEGKAGLLNEYFATKEDANTVPSVKIMEERKMLTDTIIIEE